jgi:glycosyltransferase involved in cell wall biosynthesis
MKRSDAQPYRLLMVGNFLPSYVSSPPVGEELAVRLRQHGWDIIVTSRKLGKWARVLDMGRTTWQRRRDYDLATVDVFSGAAFRWAELTCRLLQKANKPYVLTLHGGNLPEFAQKQEQRVRKLLQAAEKVTTPSNYLKENLQAISDAIILLPNPVETAHLPYRQRTVLKPQMVWLRALHSIYNPTMAIEVLQRVQHSVPDARLTLVGPDKKDGSWQAVQNSAKMRGMEQCLTMPGGVPKSEVGQWLNGGDIFLNTTTIDNTPISVLEAMACGLCVVSTDVGGLPYLLQNRHDALLVPSGDSAAMSQAILSLLQAPELASRLSANAHQKAIRHDWNHILPQWLDLLKQVASGSARPS